MSLYETRLLAYVDIIGWSAACISESPNLVEAAGVIHRTAKEFSSDHKELLKKDPNLQVNPLFLHNEFGAFSDNFVLSLPADFGGRIFSIADTCRQLLKLGFLTRGAITIGTVHHRDNVVFGPALIEAVQMEKEAIFPRLVCSKALLEHVGEHPWGTCPVVTDQLGRNIVNLFDPSLVGEEKTVMKFMQDAWGLAEIKAHIAEEIAKYTATGDTKRLEKWRYMQDAMALMLQALPWNK